MLITITWFERIFIEGIKYLLVAHIFFGYKLTLRKKKYAILLYPLFIPLAYYLEFDLIWFFWGFWLIFFLYEVNIKDCIKSFFLVFFIVTFLDLFFYVVLMGFYPGTYSLEYNPFKLLIDVLGAFTWFLIFIKGEKYYKKIQLYWKSISFKTYTFLLISTIFASCLLGGLQIYLYQIVNKQLERLTLCAGIIIVILLLVVLFKFIKNEIQGNEREKFFLKYMDIQKFYIERLIEKNEDIRCFEHEIDRHFRILAEYCDSNDWEKLSTYLHNLQVNKPKSTNIYFGNIVIDCLVTQVVEELQKDGFLIFETDGVIPSSIFIEDTDLCVLIGNALDNAKDALSLVDAKKRFLRIEFRHFKNYLYINIENSVENTDVIFNQTSKKNKKIHGYGTYNMRKVVNKYSGTITWDIKDRNVGNLQLHIVSLKIKLQL